jgi:dienelactone hydrolase
MVALSSLHRAVDRLFVALPTAERLFCDGFGDDRGLGELVALAEAGRPQLPLDRLTVHWRGSSSAAGRFRVRVGTFESPAAAILPEESRRGVVELLLPAGQPESARPSICLMLAATSEAGSRRRRRLIAPLVAAGLGALILENPYYGERRPEVQRGAALRTVRDQFAMNLATVYEAVALLSWLARTGTPSLAITGYSQGGFMAAFAAAVVDLPTAAVPMATGRSAVPVFTADALSHLIAWERLAAEAGSLEAARARLAALLRGVDLGRFPAPPRADAAVILAARHDAFVRASEVEALHAHWPGAELRWQPRGHVTEVVLGARAQRRGIADALARL